MLNHRYFWIIAVTNTTIRLATERYLCVIVTYKLLIVTYKIFIVTYKFCPLALVPVTHVRHCLVGFYVI